MDKTTLPWGALKATEGEIPWPALEQFADALVADASLIEDLDELYDESLEAAWDDVSYAFIYVAAIFALAAPRLDDERRRSVAEVLVAKLITAGIEDDDTSLYVLEAACGTLGAACVPAVLDALEEEEDQDGAWCALWTLAQLAADSSDAALRDRVVHAATGLLKKADRGRASVLDAIGAAWTLAKMGRTEARPLLQRLVERGDRFGSADIEEALQWLDGKRDHEGMPETWETPVKEWLEKQREQLENWFERRDNGEAEEEEDRAAELWRNLRDQMKEEQGERAPGFEDLAPTPRPSVGRNEPCPCGSGKKFKKCCGTGEQPAAPPSPALLDADHSRARRIAHKLTEKMLNACADIVSVEELRSAVERWTGKAGGKISDDDETVVFAEYLLHDWRPDGGKGKTAAERFAETEGHHLSREEQAQLGVWLRHLRSGYFEVEDVSPGTHVTTLRDRMVGDTVQVYDISVSRSAQRGNLMIASIFPSQGRFEIRGFGSRVPRRIRIPFENWLRREYADWRARREMPDKPASWSRFLSESLPEIQRKLRAMANVPPLLVLSTGEPVASGSVVYSVNDRRAALETLKAFSPLQPEGFGEGRYVKGEHFGWPLEGEARPLPFERPIPEMNEDGRRVLMMQSSRVTPETIGKLPKPGERESIAMVVLGEDELEIAAMSKERLEYVRPLLEAQLGTTVTFQRSEQTGPNMVDEIWKEREKPRAKEWVAPKDPKLKRLESEFREKLWREWIDQPIKALGGKTPREAASDPRLRGELEALLRDINEDTELAHPGGTLGTGFAEKVRRELGIL